MEQAFSPSLAQNEAALRKLFSGSDDVIFRSFAVGDHDQFPMLLVCIDNLSQADVIESGILTNLMNRARIRSGNLRQVNRLDLAVGEMAEVQTLAEAADAILVGDTLLLMEGNAYGLVASTKGWPTRGVPAAENEMGVEGPKDAFCESVSTNIVLIRRRLRDPALKVVRPKIGTRSHTTVGILHMEGVTRPAVLRAVTRRLSAIQTDAILDSGQLAQLLEHRHWSPFPRMQLTERPDKAAAALLEGRVVLVVDNSPFVLILPTTLHLLFQAAEDYYAHWLLMSFLRFSRYVAAVLAVSLPGLYLALTLYHPNLIPTALALKIAEGRLRVPFPAVVEVLLMELSFELLREAGVRLPTPLGSTIGIVGGILIGQSAVEAGLVGPAVVIVAAATGICTFVIPNPSLVNGLRLSKYLVLALSAFLGLWGLWLGWLLLLSHLASLSSCGFPYLYPFCSGTLDGDAGLADSLLRLPPHRLKRPIFVRPGAKKEGTKEASDV